VLTSANATLLHRRTSDGFGRRGPAARLSLTWWDSIEYHLPSWPLPPAWVSTIKARNCDRYNALGSSAGKIIRV
jgi:hypothetical protein